MTDSSHPSFFELDRLALGHSSDSAIADHARECELCRAHLARVQATVPIPDWVRALEQQDGRFDWVRGLGRWFTAHRAVVAATVVASLGLAMVSISGRFATRPEDEGTFTTVRGAPGVAVHVKRGARVRRWRPGFAVRSGDQVRVEVAPDGYSRVAVFRYPAAGRLTRLYEGPVAPEGNTVLPPAWELDDAIEDERLVVAFGKAPLDAGSVLRALQAGRSGETDDGVWVRTVVLERTGEADR